MSPTGNSQEPGDEDVRPLEIYVNEKWAEEQRYNPQSFINKSQSCQIFPPESNLPVWDGVGGDEGALYAMLNDCTTMNNGVLGETQQCLQEIVNYRPLLSDLVGKNAQLTEYHRTISICNMALQEHIAIRDAKDVHTFADTATNLFSSGAVMDQLVDVVCARTRTQIGYANFKFEQLYNGMSMGTYVEEQLNGSNFSKFIYYIVDSSGNIGPNNTLQMAFPRSIYMDCEMIRKATKVF
jgi:hypothetical protein